MSSQQAIITGCSREQNAIHNPSENWPKEIGQLVGTFAEMTEKLTEDYRVLTKIGAVGRRGAPIFYSKASRFNKKEEKFLRAAGAESIA